MTCTCVNSLPSCLRKKENESLWSRLNWHFGSGWLRIRILRIRYSGQPVPDPQFDLHVQQIHFPTRHSAAYIKHLPATDVTKHLTTVVYSPSGFSTALELFTFANLLGSCESTTMGYKKIAFFKRKSQFENGKDLHNQTQSNQSFPSTARIRQSCSNGHKTQG